MAAKKKTDTTVVVNSAAEFVNAVAPPEEPVVVPADEARAVSAFVVETHEAVRLNERKRIAEYVGAMAEGYEVSGSETDRMMGIILRAVSGNIRDGVHHR